MKISQYFYLLWSLVKFFVVAVSCSHTVVCTPQYGVYVFAFNWFAQGCVHERHKFLRSGHNLSVLRTSIKIAPRRKFSARNNSAVSCGRKSCWMVSCHDLIERWYL